MITIVKDTDETYTITGLSMDQIRAIENAGSVFCTDVALVPVADAIQDHNLTETYGGK